MMWTRQIRRTGQATRAIVVERDAGVVLATLSRAVERRARAKRVILMSSYMVVADVSDKLRSILWEAFNADPLVRSIVGSEAAIVLTNPTETVRDSANRLSLWLYQITENEFMKNQPMQRAERSDRHDQLQFPPLALNLFYLVTPFTPSGRSDHVLLAKAMQTLYDNAITPLQTPNDVAEELRIVLCRLSLEELTRIWEALREPYRLSICYQVRVTTIESERRPEYARVSERTNGYGTKSGEVVQ
jgi:hypothetical protein